MRYRNASPGKKVFIILLQLVMLTYVLLIIYPLFNMDVLLQIHPGYHAKSLFPA